MKKSTLFALFVAGAGTGWLVGLSFSPVVGSVLGSILGIAGAVVAAAAGVPLKDRSPLGEIRPAPLAALVLGIAILAPVGVIARDHGWLAPSLEEQVRRAAYLRASGFADMITGDSTAARPEGGLYLTHPKGTCGKLIRTDVRRLRQALADSQDSVLVAVAKAVDDTTALKAIRDSLCIPAPPNP